MAGTTGRISSLPGSVHCAPDGILCDGAFGACKKLATVRIQGETDSLGCEMHDYCKRCHEAIQRRAKKNEPTHAKCGWCKSLSASIAPIRDCDEGMAGPVYHVCADCRKKHNEAALDYDDNDDDCGYWHD